MRRLSYQELEAAWQTLHPGPRDRGEVVLIVTRGSVAQMAKADRPPGHHVLRAPLHAQPEHVELSPVHGVIGDRWHAKQSPDAQVSLTSLAVSRLVANGATDRYHLFGNNFIVDFDLSRDSLPVGSRLAIGTAIIEITAEPHAPCNRYQARFGKEARRWVDAEAHKDRHMRGRFARVITGGQVRLGDSIRRQSPGAEIG